MWEQQQSHKNKGETLEKERQEEGRDSRAGQLVSRNKPVSSEVSKATEERFTPDRMTAGKVSSLRWWRSQTPHARLERCRRSALESRPAVAKQLSTELPFDPAIPALGDSQPRPMQTSHMEHTQMLTAAAPLTAGQRNQHTHPSAAAG